MKLVTIVSMFILGISLQASAQSSSTANSVEATFKKDKFIEVAFLSVKPDKAASLQNEYFKNVFPIAQEYGLKSLATINVEYAYSDYVQPQMVGFFEWESKESHEAFLKDPRFLKIKPIRDAALSFLRMGYFTVAEDTKVTFKSGDLVEIYAMWLDAKEGHRMQTYFKNVTPLITGKGNKYDVKFPLSLTPVNYGADSYNPQSFGIAIWKSKKSNTNFFSSRAYGKIKHDKDAAIKRLDVWQGKIVIQ